MDVNTIISTGDYEAKLNDENEDRGIIWLLRISDEINFVDDEIYEEHSDR